MRAERSCASTGDSRPIRSPCCRSRRSPNSRTSRARCSKLLQPHFMCDYDVTQSIGRRYRRQDEVGTPYCVTVDFDDARGPRRDRARPRHDRTGARADRRTARDRFANERGSPDVTYDGRGLLFGTVAEQYDLYRPAPPAIVATVLGDVRGLDVLEVGAGTGKWTRLTHRTRRERHRRGTGRRHARGAACAAVPMCAR